MKHAPAPIRAPQSARSAGTACMRCVFSILLLLAATVGCRESRVDAATLEHTATGIRLHVTILGHATDARVAPIREALAHWNSELLRLGRTVQLDSGSERDRSVSDEILRAASGEVAFGYGPAISRLRSSLSGVPGDIVIALSDTDLISFGIPWRAGGQGVVALRRADIPPLSLPNTVRNVVAHELGHVLGLPHNTDATTLMCGRPAPCRPAVFASDSVHFFPLTPSDERLIRERWP
jgi:hypothetical protein